MAYKINPDIKIVTVDTGRLGEESYAFIDQVRAHYGISIDIKFPDTGEVEKLITANGANSFYNSVNSRLVCCQIRKVRPLQKALDGFDAWITGLRRDQWASRINIRKIELDHDHGAIVKLNPLADWSEDEVEEYTALNNVPRHPLYAQGYTSIGCKPCTRAVAPGEESRAGRWCSPCPRRMSIRLSPIVRRPARRSITPSSACRFCAAAIRSACWSCRTRCGAPIPRKKSRRCKPRRCCSPK